MADHSKPLVTSTYTNFVTELDGRFDDLALGLDPATTTPTNLPTGAIRWNSASSKWEKWSGTAWADLAASYNINLSGPLTLTANSSSDALRITQTGAGNCLVVEDSTNPDSTPFVIDTNGNAIVGLASSTTINSVSPAFEANANGASSISNAVINWSSAGSGAGGATQAFARSISGTRGSQGAVVSGTVLSNVSSYGSDGSAFVEAARISAIVDGTPSANDMPGRLVFSTTADGASSPTERMRIDSSGNVGVNTTAPEYKLDITAADNVTTTTALAVQNASRNYGVGIGAYQLTNRNIGGTVTTSDYTFDVGGAAIFNTNGSERMRITSVGSLILGGAAVPQVSFYNRRDITGSTTSHANHSNGTVQSDVTSIAYAYSSDIGTAAASFTLGAMTHFSASQAAFGAGSTVTNQHGFRAESDLTGATNNYGFYANNISVSTGKSAYGFYSGINTGTGTNYNFYAAGTAPNYFAGFVGINQLNPTEMLDVEGSARLTSASSLASNSNKIQLGRRRTNLAIVANNDRIGNFVYSGWDGASYIESASIDAYVDGTPGANDMPGRLVFSTTADGASTPTERLRIDSEGRCDMRSSMAAGGGTGTASSISGTTLTIGGTVTGTFYVGDRVFGTGVEPNTFITALGTGTGGAGTYTVSNSQTVASGVITSVNGGWNVFRFTDTDTSAAINQPMGMIEWYGSDASTPGAGVKAYIAGVSESTTPDASLIFGTADNVASTQAKERMRIDSNGNLLVGTTTNSYGVSTGIQCNSAGHAINGQTSATNGYSVYSARRTGSDGYVFQCERNTTVVGGISITGSATAFNTSSDYRLKENIQPMQNALYVVAQLNPVTYTWKADGSDGQGFIAHELQAVVPDCVTGEKDAVDEEGNPVYQGIDTSFLVATLTKAIQELKAELDATKAEVAALKGIK